MDAMTPQGQALYCNEHVENAYDFWSIFVYYFLPYMVDNI